MMLKHQVRSPAGPSAMSVALSLNAISFLNQISRAEAQRIERALARLSSEYALLSQSHVRRVAGMEDQSGPALSSYAAARGVKAFFFVEGNTINVVEIIRQGQIDSLKALTRGGV